MSGEFGPSVERAREVRFPGSRAKRFVEVDHEGRLLLSVANLDGARRFFGNVFGWRFEKFDMPDEYYRISTGPEGEPGIDGGLGAVDDAPVTGGRPMTQITVSVASVEQVLSSVEANGGRILEAKTLIPGVGWYATCAEPGGLVFGVIEADPAAGHPAP